MATITGLNVNELTVKARKLTVDWTNGRVEVDFVITATIGGSEVTVQSGVAPLPLEQFAAWVSANVSVAAVDALAGAAAASAVPGASSASDPSYLT